MDCDKVTLLRVTIRETYSEITIKTPVYLYSAARNYFLKNS